MSKSEILHELYNQCQDIDFRDSQQLIMQAESEDEADFINAVTDCLLQQRQRRAIAEKRF